jgi:GNAT superfamily N-acetyltransferase
MTLSRWHVREGRKADCSVLARMIDSASEGAAQYLFEGLRVDRSPLELLADQLTTEVHYSYANTLVITEDDETPAGMALSFPASGLVLGEAALNLHSDNKQQYLKYFIDNKINDSWHLDAIYVDEPLRSDGLGKKLLNEIKHKAAYYKFPTLQVFVFGVNERALGFYLHNDFVIDKEISVGSHEFLKDKKMLVRMRCNL